MIETLFPNGLQHYFVGGLLIGTGIGLLYVLTGLIGGMSTVFSSTWSYFSRAAFFAQQRLVASREWRIWYAVGLVLGGIAFALPTATGELHTTSVSWWALGIGGFLAGFGARLANGCTSGHGICGLGSLKLPSLAAVVTFMVTAMVTANLVAVMGGAR